MPFGANFFVSPTGSKHLREMKTSTNDKNQWPSRHPPIFLKWWTITLLYVYCSGLQTRITAEKHTSDSQQQAMQQLIYASTLGLNWPELPKMWGRSNLYCQLLTKNEQLANHSPYPSYSPYPSSLVKQC